MLSGRAPWEYVYLSKRLLTDLFRHERAVSAPKWRLRPELHLPFVTVRPGRVEPDPTNLHDLAMRSLGEVEDFTGPAGRSPYYIHDDFELQSGVFRALMGWSGGHVACFSGEKVTADGEHIFVALFGSASNMIGRKEQKDDFAYYPSDIAGLYGLLDAAREADDPDIDFHYRWEDQSSSTEGRVEAAVMFARGGATRPARRLRFLARVFIEADSYDFGGDRFDSVIVGTPLWVSTTPPQRDDLHRAQLQRDADRPRGSRAIRG